MQRTNTTLVSCIIVLAVLLGIVGGALMGGMAGYYVAASMRPVSVPSTLTVSNNPTIAPAATTNLTLKEDSAVIDAVRKVKPTVVTVVNRMQPRRSFFGSSVAPTASGSGVIIDPKGYIVTNNHVVSGANSLQVILSDGTKADATLVGTDAIAATILTILGDVIAIGTLSYQILKTSFRC